MNLENLFTALYVGKTDTNFPIKSTGTKQRRIQNIRAVRCRDNDDPFLRIKTIHLNKKRVQSLLALIMTTAHTVPTVTTYRINLIDKNKAGSTFPTLLKHVTHTGSTNTYKHFNKIRSTDRKEGYLRFTGNRSRKKGFSSSRRSYHENPFRNVSAQLLEFLRIAKVFHDLPYFFFSLFDSGNVFESDLALVHRHQLRFALAKTHRAFSSRFDLMAEKKVEKNEKEKDRHVK